MYSEQDYVILILKGEIMPEDDLRYSRISDILRVVYMMMSEPKGITLDDICDECNVSRRTAERMRNAITNIFYQVTVLNENEKVKRWGFENFSMKEIVTFTDEEIATMETLKLHFRAALEPEMNTIIDKMKALRKKKR